MLSIIVLLMCATVIIDFTEGGRNWQNWLHWLVFLSVAIGLFTSLFGIEGSWVCFVFSIVSYAIYIYFCIITNYYGELIVSFLVIGANIVTLVKWKRNTTNGVVKINKISLRELLICAAIFIIFTIALGFILKLINTEYPFLNSICVTSMAIALYFSFRISRNEFLLNIIGNSAYLTLWIFAAIRSDFSFILFSIGGVIEIGYAIYGYFHWGKIHQKQNT